jgi:hypothetical protein
MAIDCFAGTLPIYLTLHGYASPRVCLPKNLRRPEFVLPAIIRGPAKREGVGAPNLHIRQSAVVPGGNRRTP